MERFRKKVGGDRGRKEEKRRGKSGSERKGEEVALRGKEEEGGLKKKGARA